MNVDRPLHRSFPTLGRKLAHCELADLPTPVRSLDGQNGALFCKDDSRSHALYGGNKVRKLEYVFGQALHHGCTQVATFGAAGSNHATATALHAQRMGLRCINFLSHQPATPWTAGNLRRQIASGARLEFVHGSLEQCQRQADDMVAASAHKTWMIPMGGSSVAGTIGYVNAAFELREQIERGELPLVHRLYAPLGTMGTVVGLALGLAAAGLPTTVMAARVVHPSIGSEPLARQLFGQTARALHRLDPTFPALSYDPQRLVIRDEFYGPGYACPTDAGRDAVAHAKARWSLELETTYSGKAAAALLADAEMDDHAHLFWMTYNAAPSRDAPDSTALDRVPEPLRPYLQAGG